MIIHKINRRGHDAKKRVAAYCRVSTDRATQEESYEKQLSYYHRLIQANPEWEFAGVYADQGRSGTSIKRRPGFQRLLGDALGPSGLGSGKIDVILVKSISRFSRNLVDCDQAVRELKAAGVEVRFEREHISTFDPSAGFLFSILAAVAQDESRSISENVRWAYTNSFRKGRYNLGNHRVLGYDSISGKLIPNKDAWIVREVFRRFVAGERYSQIARSLQSMGAVGLRGAELLCARTIKSMLTNETYIGDKRLQKQPPRNYLTKRPDCSVPYESYYLRDDHEAIIDRNTWEKVQARLAKRGK